MDASEVAFALIMHFEKEIPPLTAYWDELGGVWTIGWGHTRTAKKGMVITLDDAKALLISDVGIVVPAINEVLKVGITQNMFDALVSFTFNVGTHAFMHSTLLRMLNEGNIEGAANEFLRWTFSGKEKTKVQGLINRREAERNLFLAGLPRLTSKEAH